MTKLVICEEVSLRRCEMMKDPQGVGRSVGVGVKYYGVIMCMDVR